jgi:hypothetical protein
MIPHNTGRVDILDSLSWEVPPTHSRVCRRCGQKGYKGGKSNMAFWRTMYPTMSSGGLIPRVGSEAEFVSPLLKWEVDPLNVE